MWVATCALMVFAMIVVGGVTRVTRSGLSITTWDPVVGALPPGSERAWSDVFARYQASPEGMHVNAGITFAAFRSLYLVEYVHRLLARVTALMFMVPLVIFVVRGDLGLRRPRGLFVVLGVLCAGIAQGVLGWYMVASGLVDAPFVSPFRLAAHLLLGMALLGALVWSAITRTRTVDAAPRGAHAATVLALAATTVAIAFGALMAGHHAGLLCSTFPTMNGAWVPRALRLSPRAVVENAWTVHFAHRLLALLVGASVLCAGVVWRRGSRRQRLISTAAMGCVALQVTLGALLVVQHVPQVLAVLHQATAALLVVILVTLLREAGRLWR